MNEVERVKAKYKKLYSNNTEEQLEKFDSLLENLARCEIDLNRIDECIKASGGTVLVHPDYKNIQKINPLVSEATKVRASYQSLITTAERFLGGAEEEEDDGLSAFE